MKTIGLFAALVSVGFFCFLAGRAYQLKACELPYNAQDCQLTLLATAEDGTKCYRLTGPYTVVPAIIVVGRDGRAVIR